MFVFYLSWHLRCANILWYYCYSKTFIEWDQITHIFRHIERDMLPAPRSLYFKIRQDKYKTRHLTTAQLKKSLGEERQKQVARWAPEQCFKCMATCERHNTLSGKWNQVQELGPLTGSKGYRESCSLQQACCKALQILLFRVVFMGSEKQLHLTKDRQDVVKVLLSPALPRPWTRAS